MDVANAGLRSLITCGQRYQFLDIWVFACGCFYETCGVYTGSPRATDGGRKSNGAQDASLLFCNLINTQRNIASFPLISISISYEPLDVAHPGGGIFRFILELFHRLHFWSKYTAYKINLP